VAGLVDSGVGGAGLVSVVVAGVVAAGLVVSVAVAGVVAAGLAADSVVSVFCSHAARSAALARMQMYFFIVVSERAYWFN
jgi:ABC-type amino acid transport system permease subunit